MSITRRAIGRQREEGAVNARRTRSRPSVCGWSRVFFFSSRRRHTRFDCDWSSDVCSSDLLGFLRLHRSVRSTHRELAAHRPGEAGWNHARISRAEPAPRSTGPSLPGGQVESELTRRILVTREVLTTWGYKNSSCSCFPAQPNGVRLSCGAEREYSQMEFYPR